MLIGYHASHKQFSPSQLLGYVQAAAMLLATCSTARLKDIRDCAILMVGSAPAVAGTVHVITRKD